MGAVCHGLAHGLTGRFRLIDGPDDFAVLAYSAEPVVLVRITGVYRAGQPTLSRFREMLHPPFADYAQALRVVPPGIVR
jgi:hypothetical protein